jgi:pimeloyl-ACP methyl ester carboxylesterase
LNIDKRQFISFLLAAGALLLPAWPTAAQTGLRWEPFTLVTHAGEVPAEIGRLSVPERRRDAASRTIELAFVRVKSRAKTPLPPLVYLDGGPGGGGYTAAAIEAYADLFERVSVTRDVILLSQRGTGLSRPRPACAMPDPLPDDFFRSEDTMTRTLHQRAVECATELRAQGVDLAGYTTEETADDVEDLRKALKAERVALLGFSYGTHAALSVMRRWPGSVARAVLIGTEGPADTWKRPSTMDRQFEKLAAAAGVDLVAVWRRLLERTAKEPLRVAINVRGTPRTLLVGPAGLQYLLRRDIGDTNDWPGLPAAIVRAERGDLTFLSRVVARRFNGLSGGISMMPLAVDCASGASRARLDEIAREEPSPVFGRMTNYPFPGVCQALDLPMLPDTFRAPVTSDVPTLFVSGTHDSHTPPAQAEAVAGRFSQATHVIVENAGHESTLIAEVRATIIAFLGGKTVASGLVSAPPIAFLPPDR